MCFINCILAVTWIEKLQKSLSGDSVQSKNFACFFEADIVTKLSVIFDFSTHLKVGQLPE